ncbi:hypothetical protein F5Y10DRAFT_285158 [Nemania abortiva]|nr:hypothetical protein F5Y10DRAFT_285158 [Nemania abortiva]
MAGSTKDNQAKVKKSVEKKAPEKKIRKNPNPNQKRGQPTAAARLISSPYIKFGWHKPLSGEVKEAVQRVSSMADSMYMLQMDKEREIESLSLRNGLFWEQRQLANESMVSMPSADHIDLFPEEEDAFEDTLRKIGKLPLDNGQGFVLHYLFSKLRTREFLVLPVDFDGYWVTVIARMREKPGAARNLDIEKFCDREVSDLAIVDPVLSESRRHLVIRRLTSILAEGCIELPAEVTRRHIEVPPIQNSYRWQTGLIAYAVSREFLRRLKTLEWRRGLAMHSSEDFLWVSFQENYNFEAYRQSLMAACAFQCIEMSGYQARLALEVPSEDSNYQPSSLSHIRDDSFYKRDEKWEVFQSPTHTFTVSMSQESRPPPPSPPSPNVPICTMPPSPSDKLVCEFPPPPGFDVGVRATCELVPSLDANTGEQNAPDAPMEDIPGLSQVYYSPASPTPLPAAEVKQEYDEPSLKRPLPDDDGDYEDEDEAEEDLPSAKRPKIEDEHSAE